MISAKEAKNKVNESLLKMEEDAVKLADLIEDYDMKNVEDAINIAIGKYKTKCEVIFYNYAGGFIEFEKAHSKTRAVAKRIRIKRVCNKLISAGYLCESDGSLIYINFNVED